MIDKEQEQRLKDEILGDAKAKAERLLARARNDAAKIFDRAKCEAEAKRSERMGEVHKEMDVKCGAIARGLENELKRHWLSGREERLEAMLSSALEKAVSTEGAEHARSMELLAREAMAALGPCKAEVYFNAKDSELVTEKWLAAIAKNVLGPNAEFSFKPVASLEAPAGLRFVTMDGRKEYDNTYVSRLEKMKDSIRVLVSEN